MLKHHLFLIAIVIAAALSRFIPHPPNITAVGALALFSGAHFGRKSRFIVPLTALLISDIILGFHTTMPFVYGSFVIAIFLGSFLAKHPGAVRLGMLTLTSSVLFFIITNFGVWYTSTMYAPTMSGLMNAYVMGIPFFRNTILGDFMYSFGFFYGYQYSLNTMKLSRQHLIEKSLLFTA